MSTHSTNNNHNPRTARNAGGASTGSTRNPHATRASGGDKIFTRDFIVIVTLNFLLFLAFQLFPSALPVYAASIGVPSSSLGLISGALTIAALVARPLAGTISDRYGRKGILLAGLGVMFACTVAYAFCPLFIPLLIIRFIQGFGWGSATTSSSAVASDILPASRFGEGMGYYGMSVSVALAIGPAAGLALLDTFGLTVLALVGSAALLVALLLGTTVRRRPTATGLGARDLRPGANDLGADPGAEAGDPSTAGGPRASGDPGAGPGPGPGPSLGDDTARADANRPRANRADANHAGTNHASPGSIFEKGAIIPAVTMFFMMSTYGAIITFLALTAQERGIDGIGGFFVAYAVATIVSRPFVGRFIDRRGFSLTTGIGIVVMFCGLLAITLANSLAVILAAGVAYGLGQGTLQTTLQTKAITSSPANRRGAANATYFVGFDAGIGTGALIGGPLVGLFGYTGMFAAMCALPVVSFCIFAITDRRQKRRA